LPQTGQLVEPQRSFAITHERAVKDERVQMHVQPEVAAESLNRGHRPTARATYAVAPQQPSHAAKDLAKEHPQHIAQQRGITRARETDAKRTRNGSDSTHWRIGTCGSTRSTKCAAESLIRRAPQDRQNPRPRPRCSSATFQTS
jgi:hypothetical protein